MFVYKEKKTAYQHATFKTLQKHKNFTFFITFVYNLSHELRYPYVNTVGWDSSVGTATRYGLDDPRMNPGGGEIFRIRPDRPWSPTSLLNNGYRVFPGGKAAGAWR